MEFWPNSGSKLRESAHFPYSPVRLQTSSMVRLPVGRVIDVVNRGSRAPE